MSKGVESNVQLIAGRSSLYYYCLLPEISAATEHYAHCCRCISTFSAAIKHTGLIKVALAWPASADTPFRYVVALGPCHICSHDGG